MIWLTLRGLRTRWWRALLTGLVAAVGIGIVSGTLMVSDAADRVGAGEGSDIDLVRQIMLTAGGVALLVGVFVVNITVSVSVAQRTRELGLWRCVGAEAGQVRRSVLLESSVIGIVAAAVGLGLGVGVASALGTLINTGRFPGHLAYPGIVVTLRTVVAALLVGGAAMVLSTWGPAARASRLAPVAALHDIRPLGARRGAVRPAAGLLAFGAGVACVPVAVASWNGPLLLPAGAAMLTGVRLLGPAVAGGLARLVGAPVAGVAGVPGELGRKNAERSPERTAAMATALMIGIALVTLVNVLFASAQAPLLAEYRRDHADLRLWKSDQQAGRSGVPMPSGILGRLRDVAGVREVVPVLCVPGKAADAFACAADPDRLATVIDLVTTEGSLTGLGSGGVAMEQDEVTRQGLTLGSTMDISGPAGPQTFTLAGIYRPTTAFSGYLMAPAGLARLGGAPEPATVYLRAAEGVDQSALRAAVTRVAAEVDPAIEVRSRVELHERDLDEMAGAAAIYRTLTGLAALVGLFGIVGTLSLSIVERRRELGLLRGRGHATPPDPPDGTRRGGDRLADRCGTRARPGRALRLGRSTRPRALLTAPASSPCPWYPWPWSPCSRPPPACWPPCCPHGWPVASTYCAPWPPSNARRIVLCA